MNRTWQVMFKAQKHHWGNHSLISHSSHNSILWVRRSLRGKRLSTRWWYFQVMKINRLISLTCFTRSTLRKSELGTKKWRNNFLLNNLKSYESALFSLKSIQQEGHTRACLRAQTEWEAKTCIKKTWFGRIRFKNESSKNVDLKKGRRLVSAPLNQTPSRAQAASTLSKKRISSCKSYLGMRDSLRGFMMLRKRRLKLSRFSCFQVRKRH